MTITHSLHENLELNSRETRFNSLSLYNKHLAGKLHLFKEKFETPLFSNYIQRPRLNEILQKSLNNFGSTLITGRAGTGKTALAADFASNYRRVAWLGIDSADENWNIFSRYFSTTVEDLLLNQPSKQINTTEKIRPTSEVSAFVEEKILAVNFPESINPGLIVLDDIHHIFDAEWFEEFFQTLVHSVSQNVHVLMLSREVPALPLWRLRSKQVLSVIDEKLLSFNLKETAELFETFGGSAEYATHAFIKSFGRISRLKTMVKTV
jgi:LuxR family transcriptional regulator, maltose regulon positive regulatory protein